MENLPEDQQRNEAEASPPSSPEPADDVEGQAQQVLKDFLAVAFLKNKQPLDWDMWRVL
jgi:hypothetical protein